VDNSLHSIKPIVASKKAGIGKNEIGEAGGQVYPRIPTANAVNREASAAAGLGNEAGRKSSGGITEPDVRQSVSGGTTAGGTPPAGQIRPLANGTLPAEAEQLIGKLARLDDAWESGILDAEVYQTQRALWKTQLITLISLDAEADVHQADE